MRKWKCVKSNSIYFTIGRIYETDENGDGLTDDSNSGRRWTNPWRFRLGGFNGAEFEEVFKEEKKKVRKFKVGDKVRILNNNDGHGLDIGEIVEVIADGDQDSLVCKSKENGMDYYLCYMNIDLVNQTPTLDNDTMIEKLDGEYCNGRLCGDCIFSGSDCGWGDMTDEELLSAYNLAFGNDQSKAVNNSESTLTITTSDTTITLTDGTHTTSINRYYTDKHNERNAISIVIDKYYDELAEIERVSKLPKVGDKVKVVNSERTFNYYDTWLIENKVDVKYAIKWTKGATPKDGKHYTIVAIHEHLTNDDILALIEDEKGCYIINIEGLEVIK